MADAATHSARFMRLEQRLDDLGLIVLGNFTPDAGERLPSKVITKNPVGVMIASAGRAMWKVFSNSPEFSDGRPNPMDRWTGRELGVIAAEFSSKLATPFEQPYYPFQAWAMRAAGIEASPLNLLIHPKYGLWFGLRGVLFFEDEGTCNVLAEDFFGTTNMPIHPCAVCQDKPCLNGCPVGAFSDHKLYVERCFDHLDSNEYPECMQNGCNARNACPIGLEYRYHSEQLAFHMKAFRAD